MATINLGRVKPINRGVYVSSQVYNLLDIVSHGGIGYIADQNGITGSFNATRWTPIGDYAQIVSDGEVDSAKTWSSQKISEELASTAGRLINKPVITSPASGTTDYTGAVTATYSTDESYQGTQDYVKWEASTDSSFNTIVDSYEGSSNLLTWTPSIGAPLTTVYIRVKQGSDGHRSEWSESINFTTPDVYVVAPTVSVSGSPDNITQIPVLSTNAFSVFNGSDTHASTDYQVVRTSDSVVVWESLNNVTDLLSISVPGGFLEINTEYTFKARHNGTTYAGSYGEVTFTTANVYVETPTLTVEGSPDDVPETPVLSTSSFSVFNGSDTHVSTDWEIRLTADNSLIWSSMNNTTNKFSIVVPASYLLEGTSYKFRVRHNGDTYGSSSWAEVTATTKAEYFDPLTDDPVPIGTLWEGGYYAGKMQQDDGIYALIVAPRGLGDNNGATITWHSSSVDTTGAASTYDGFTNTQDMISYTNGGVKTWIQNVNSTGINGFNDWYLPAIHELQLLYRNLKPTTDTNYISIINIGDGCTRLGTGANPHSVPTSTANTSSVPAQTSITDFQTGGSEAFLSTYYWSSSERCDSPAGAWGLGFFGGSVDGTIEGKGGGYYVRAVRRMKLS